MARPSKNIDKRELDRKVREFVAELKLHSPTLTNAELERRLGLAGDGSHGKKIGRWSRAGLSDRGQGTTLDQLQQAIEKALELGLLPPRIKGGGIKRHDPIYVGSDERAEDILATQLAQAKDLEKSRAAAVAALAAYASAVKGASDWWVIQEVIDHGPEETPDGTINNTELIHASPEEILGLAKKLESHWWHFMPNF